MLILDTYNSKRRQFKIGKSYVSFTANDISHIFGIPNGSKPLDLKYGKRKGSEFISRRFQGPSRVSAPKIKEQLHLALSGSTDIEIADVARLICLYILVVLFFSTHGNTIGWSYVGYVEKYMDMKNYAWAEEISKFLMESVHSRSRGSDKVIGCLIALPYWLCEHSTIVSPNESLHFPRILKWNLRAVSMALRKKPLHTLKVNEVLGESLESTLLESQRFLSLLGSVSGAEGGLMQIEGEEEVKETEKIQEERIVEDNEEGEEEKNKNVSQHVVVSEEEKSNEGEEQEEGHEEEEHQNQKEVHVAVEEAEGDNENEGEEQEEPDEEEEQQQEKGENETDNKMNEGKQSDTDMMIETLVISELEEQREQNNSEETTSAGVEMADYNQMALETDLVVANILADIIGNATNASTNVPSETITGTEQEAADIGPSTSNPSHSIKNNKLQNLTEERDRATSLANQLTKDNKDLQEQIQRMAIELERTSVENNSLKKERLEMEKRIESLLKERDNALLMIEQLTNEKNSLETCDVKTDQTIEDTSRMVNSLKEQLKHTMSVSDIQSSRAAKAENEGKELKKKIINLESNNMKLRQLLKEMTLDYAEKGLEWAGNTLDDIFQSPKSKISEQKGSRIAQEKAEGSAADQKIEENADEINYSDTQIKPVKEVKQSSMIKRIKKRRATRKMIETAAPFRLPRNTVTKQMTEPDIEKLKQIYEAEGNEALVWGAEGISAVSYEDIIAILNKAEFSSNVIDGYADLLYREQEEIQQQLTASSQHGLLPQEKSIFISSLCWKFVTANTSEMREKILHKQISPSRTANHRFVHFPMNSNGKRKNAQPFHWTLLVLDQKEGDWLHYNSLKPRLAKTVDHYFEDAQILKQYVENYNYVNIEETQPYGAPLISVEDAPQQKMGSVDCGVIVCYIMKQITHKQPIDSKLQQNIIDDLRREIVSKFLNDMHHCWSIQNFHARREGADDDFEQ